MSILKHIVFAGLLIATQHVVAQNSAVLPSDSLEGIEAENPGMVTDVDIFSYEEEAPKFKGDMAAFIGENYIFSDYIQAKGIGGVLYVLFIVETDGTVTDVKILPGKGLTPEQDAEAIRVIKLTSGKWTPHKINGVPVRALYKQQFVFTFDEE